MYCIDTCFPFILFWYSLDIYTDLLYRYLSFLYVNSLSFILTVLYYSLFAAFCSPSSLTWPIWPGVSHWIQYTQCVLILQIAVCEIHPTCSRGSSHITQNGTASHILPLFLHRDVLSLAAWDPALVGLYGESLLDKSLKNAAKVLWYQVVKSATLSYKYISHAGLEVTLNCIIFLFCENSEQGDLIAPYCRK